MTVVQSEVSLKIECPEGAETILWIGQLPGAEGANQLQIGPTADNETLQVQLLEGCEYLFEWRYLPDTMHRVSTEPREVFQPDTIDGKRGRVRPGLFVGRMPVSLVVENTVVGGSQIEVRSRKLNYDDEYAWMLEDIARQVSEMLMNRFAASEAAFVPDETRDALTLSGLKIKIECSIPRLQ